MIPPTDNIPSDALPPEPVFEAPPVQRFSAWRTFQTVISVAILVATLFTLWTPANLFSGSLAQKMAIALQPSPTAPASAVPGDTTTTPTVNPQIGIVAGHWGNDSGAVCQDGLTEASVNLEIATLVKNTLVGQGFDVDLLQEFDERLSQYRAGVLVSIHNDSCDYINDEATGFKVAAALNSTNPEESNRLVACMTDRYQKVTGLRFHYNSITADMTQYHAYNEIDTSTTAAVIETGFLNLDRQMLTEHTDLIAQGITEGILCFVRHETFEPTAAPTVQP